MAVCAAGGPERAAQFDAPAEGEAHVLLHAVPVVRSPQSLLPGRALRQEDHRAARQVVLQLQVRPDFRSHLCSAPRVEYEYRTGHPVFLTNGTYCRDASHYIRYEWYFKCTVQRVSFERAH